MDYQSEAELEKQLLDQLIGLGYKSIVVNDETQLEKNFRTQLYLHNQSKMKSKPFTDAEFERVKIFLDGKSVFQSAKLLRYFANNLKTNAANSQKFSSRTKLKRA